MCGTASEVRDELGKLVRIKLRAVAQRGQALRRKSDTCLGGGQENRHGSAHVVQPLKRIRHLLKQFRRQNDHLRATMRTQSKRYIYVFIDDVAIFGAELPVRE